MANDEIMNAVDSVITTEDVVSDIAIADTKVSIDWKAAGLGFGAAVLVGGLIYGGYRGYKYFKKKKELEDEE